MSKPTKRLGRGLNSLVSDLRNPAAVKEPPTAAGLHVAAPPAPASGGQPAGTQTGTPLEVPLSEIKPNPYQPRLKKSDESIQELADSIRENGILQPIVLRAIPEGGYHIIAGERRFLAAKTIALGTVPAILKEASDQQMLELALVENIQREDLNAIDRAKAYRRYCDEFSLKPEAVAKKLGENRTTVVNYLRLLELEDEIQDLVIEGSISMGHARSLLSLSNRDARLDLAQRIVEEGLSVRALEALVRSGKTGPDSGSPSVGSASGKANAKTSAHIKDIEKRMEQAVKTKVHIREGGKKGRGRITIEYYSFDDFDRICELLGVELE